MKALSLLFLAVVPLADPPPKPSSDGVTLAAVKPVVVDLGKKCVIEVTTTAKKVSWKIPAEVDYVQLDGKRLACWALPGTYVLTAMVPSGDDVLSTEVILTVSGPRPPPVKLELKSSAASGQIPFTVQFTATGDTTDGILDFGDGTTTKILPATHAYVTAGKYTATLKTPSESSSVSVVATAGPGPMPPPVPVTSFRVIFAQETGATIPQAQKAVMNAKSVLDWLTANTTPEGGLAGWRNKDKDSNATNDTPTMKAMWDAVKPKITAVPCVAIERNGKVDILPLEATPEAMLEVFKKYKGN